MHRANAIERKRLSDGLTKLGLRRCERGEFCVCAGGAGCARGQRRAAALGVIVPALDGWDCRKRFVFRWA